jgi:hypothetical protein
MKLYYVYDAQGFMTAKTETDSGDPIYSHEIDIIHEMAGHDLLKGFCSSYQIYLETGELIFNSEAKEGAA